MNNILLRAPSDPIATRLSVGGTPAIGVYCVYRGDIRQALWLAEEALVLLRAQALTGQELPITGTPGTPLADPC